ncbi:hypothetical protein SRHO_G00175930 [Serrasalmus rhombeus]
MNLLEGWAVGNSADPPCQRWYGPKERVTVNFDQELQHSVFGDTDKMSCVKEECEDVSVMEASGVKIEDEEVETGTVLREDIKEEFKLEVKPFEEVCAAQKSDQNAQHEKSISDHLGIHTGEEAFSCSQCGKNFTSQRSLKHHMDAHEGTRPHQCSHTVLTTAPFLKRRTAGAKPQHHSCRGTPS